MSNVVKIPELIKYFDNRIRKSDSHRIGDSLGKEPCYPMMVIFLGEDAIKNYTIVADNINSVWPQYKDELLFLGVDGTGDDSKYYRLSNDNDTVEKSLINKDDIGNLISKLYSLESHFQNHSNLLLYYVVDTTSFTKGQMFTQWMDTLKKTREVFDLSSIQHTEMLSVLLNENIGERKKIANYIRHEIRNFGEDDVKSVLMLSNRRSDNVILEDFNICYGIVSSIIELSNNSDVSISSVLFNKGVYTVRYAREEKPSLEIGQVIINEMIDYMSHKSFNMDANPLDYKGVNEKLGITKEHTISFLDAYAENNLFKLLPSSDELRFFPRTGMEDMGDVSRLTEKEFNELTMNSWKAFLNEIINKAQERISKDKLVRSQWKAEFSKRLLDEFNIMDLIWMKDHLEDVKELYINNKLSSTENIDVLNAAKFKLRYMLSSQAELINIFIDTIKELGEKSEEYLNDFKELVKSKRRLHAVKDDTITTFYTRKIRNYFDHNGVDFNNKLNDVCNIEELRDLLLNTIKRIIDNDDIFEAPFEEELEERLLESAQPKDAKLYIRRKLTGIDVPLFFQTNFSCGDAVASSILIKTGTSLYENLHNNLSPSTYYYNTGNGNSAESIDIYRIDNDNIENEAFEEEK